MTFFNIFVKSVLLAYDKKLNFHCTKRTKMIKKNLNLLTKCRTRGYSLHGGLSYPLALYCPNRAK